MRIEPHKWKRLNYHFRSCRVSINSVRGECRAQRGVSNHGRVSDGRIWGVVTMKWNTVWSIGLLCGQLGSFQYSRAVAAVSKLTFLGDGSIPSLKNVHKVHVVPVSLMQQDEKLQPIAFLGTKKEGHVEPFGTVIRFERSNIPISLFVDTALDAFNAQTMSLFGSPKILQPRNKFFLVEESAKDKNSHVLWVFMELSYIPAAIFQQTINWLLNKVYKGGVSPDVLTSGFTHFEWSPLEGLSARVGITQKELLERYAAQLKSAELSTWQRSVGAPPSFADAVYAMHERVSGAQLVSENSNDELKKVLAGISVPDSVLNELKKSPGLFKVMAPQVWHSVKGVMLRKVHKRSIKK